MDKERKRSDERLVAATLSCGRRAAQDLNAIDRRAAFAIGAHQFLGGLRRSPIGRSNRQRLNVLYETRGLALLRAALRGCGVVG